MAVAEQIGILDHEDILRVVAERHIDLVADLEVDCTCRHEHNDRNGVLQGDEDAAVEHLRAGAEGPLHHINRFVGRDRPGGQQSRYDSDSEHAAQGDSHITEAHLAPNGVVVSQQATRQRRSPLGQAQRHKGREEGEQDRLANHAHHHLAFRSTQQAACGHLLGTQSGLRHREVDVVDKRKEEQDECHREEHQHKIAVALVELGRGLHLRKVVVGKGQQLNLVVVPLAIDPIELFARLEHLRLQRLHIDIRSEQQAAHTGTGIVHAFVV